MEHAVVSQFPADGVGRHDHPQVILREELHQVVSAEPHRAGGLVMVSACPREPGRSSLRPYIGPNGAQAQRWPELYTDTGVDRDW
jgi:hypothetical protein